MTMSNYKEPTITGYSYTRCNQVLISNRLGAVPQIRFDEQVVVTMETGGTIINGSGSIEMDFDAAKMIPLIDPTTGAATGQSVSYGTVYAMLYSGYIDGATSRDAAQPVPEGV
jgi:hypothetical protein